MTKICSDSLVKIFTNENHKSSKLGEQILALIVFERCKNSVSLMGLTKALAAVIFDMSEGDREAAKLLNLKVAEMLDNTLEGYDDLSENKKKHTEGS